MELDEQVSLGHLLLQDRKCKKCGEIKNLIDGFMSGTKAGIKALATFLGDYAGAMIKVQVKDLTKSECSNSELKLCNEQMVDVLTQLHTEMKWRGNITATAQTKGMKKIGIRLKI